MPGRSPAPGKTGCVAVAQFICGVEPVARGAALARLEQADLVVVVQRPNGHPASSATAPTVYSFAFMPKLCSLTRREGQAARAEAVSLRDGRVRASAATATRGRRRPSGGVHQAGAALAHQPALPSGNGRRAGGEGQQHSGGADGHLISRIQRSDELGERDDGAARRAVDQASAVQSPPRTAARPSVSVRGEHRQCGCGERHSTRPACPRPGVRC